MWMADALIQTMAPISGKDHQRELSFSTLDEWWIEGCIRGLTDWSIGEREVGLADAYSFNRQDADYL